MGLNWGLLKLNGICALASLHFGQGTLIQNLNQQQKLNKDQLAPHYLEINILLAVACVQSKQLG